MDSRHESLQRKHALLENELQQELHRAHPDASIIQTIKKRKLLIKEQITGMMETG